MEVSEKTIVRPSGAYGIGPIGAHHSYDGVLSRIGASYGDMLQKWDIPGGASVLDIAAGQGEVAEFLRHINGATVYQTDISIMPLVIQKKRNSDSEKIFVADSMRQPFASHMFDAIHMKDALVHVEDTVGFFTEMHRLLKPDGSLLIVTQETEENIIFVRSYDTKGQGNVETHRIPFENFSHYQSLINEIGKNGMMYEHRVVDSISPPYFATRKEDFEPIARACGFILRKNQLPSLWTPKAGEPDWLHESRDVFEFIAVDQSEDDALIRDLFALKDNQVLVGSSE